MALVQNFSGHQAGLDTPAEAFVAVTPNDGADLPDGVCRALLVGTPGNANCDDARGNTNIALALQAGYNPIRVKRVRATGLTAANIVALY